MVRLRLVIVNKREVDEDGLECVTHIKDKILFQKTPKERCFDSWHDNLMRTKIFPISDI